MIKKYSHFINENKLVQSESDFNDIFNAPLEERQQIKSSLEDLVNQKSNESFVVNESYFQSVVDKFKQWLTTKAVAWLINQNERVLRDKIRTLQMLDPTDLTDISDVKAMYLGGGIDKASEEGASGWRDWVEEYFGDSHVVKGDDMIELAANGNMRYENYDKPLLLNPMRNELVRTNDPRFGEIFGKWKSGKLNKETDPEDWKYWADIINKEIYAPDLRIVNACDSNLVKLDPAAGAGTLGEMQISALKNMNIFLWLDGGYEVQDISPWTIPSITKLVRTKEECEMLLDGIKQKNL